MNIVKYIKELEMLDFLRTNGTACRFVAMTSKTPVVDIRVDNPWGAGKKTKSGLYKVSKKIGIVNANYNTSVRRKIAEAFGVELKEVEYENGETWYVHEKTLDGKPLPVVKHAKKESNERYLQYFPQHSSNVYVNDLDEVVPDEEVAPFLYKSQERSDFKPAVIVVKIENIKELKISGIILQAEDYDEARAALEAA